MSRGVGTSGGGGWRRPAARRGRRLRRRMLAGTAVLGGLVLVLVLALAGCEADPPAEEGSGGQAAMQPESVSYPRLDEASVVAPAAGGGVWVGTETAGLVRWQAGGTAYRHHPLPEGSGGDGLEGGVESLAVADGGAVWVATGHPGVDRGEAAGDGVFRFDGGEWTRWTAADGLPHDRATSVAAGGGAVWAATPKGVARFDGDGWTTYAAAEGLAHDEAVRVAAGADGTVWAVTTGEQGGQDGRSEFGLSRFDGEEWTSWTTAGELAVDNLGALAVAADGSVWIDVLFGADAAGGEEIAVANFDGQEWTRAVVDDGHNVRSATSLAVAGDGAVWAATRAGVYRFDGQNWAGWLGAENFRSVAVGEDGTVWAATRRGVWRFDGNAWTSWTTEVSPPDQIRSMAVTRDDTLWAAMGQTGLARFDGQQWTVYPPEDTAGLQATQGYAVAAGGGSVWAASSDSLGGAVRFDVGEWTAYTPEGGLAHAAVDALTVGADGTLWAASHALATEGHDYGLSRFDGGQWTTWTGEDGLPQATVTALAVGGDGTVWAGTQQSGVWRFDGETWTTYTDADGLASRAVNDVAVAGDGTLWAATRIGLSRFDGQQWTTFVDDDGLPANQVNGVTVAADGTVWAAVSDHSKLAEGGTGGLSAFDGEQWTTWTVDDGLIDNWVTTVAVDGDGTVWAATSSGLSKVRPAQ